MPDHMILVGCGNMGREYYKVLKAMGTTPDVVGRGRTNADRFREETGVCVYTGGVDAALEKISDPFDTAIVAVNIADLCHSTLKLLEAGAKRVLVEKPAGMNREEITAIRDAARRYGAAVYVAYNRRFYASTEKALEIIEEDGGVSSVNFEFTEWSHVVGNLPISDAEKAIMLTRNSSHVIDLAFFFAGRPKEITSYIGGGLPWHPNGSVYAGAGYTEKGVMFSYNANWEAPGRWAVEVLTRKHRLYFKPMEKLGVQELGSVQVAEAEIDDRLDKEFKPGLYREVEALLKNNPVGRLPDIEEHLENLDYYEAIAGVANKGIHLP